MATDIKPDYKKYDSRVDALVMETRTLWDEAVGELSDSDRDWLADAVHTAPAAATNVAYYRSHTGFTREIMVTVEDVTRLYHERFAD